MIIRSYLTSLREFHYAGLAAATLLLLALSACALASTARTNETTYVLDGKTYVLQEFHHSNEHNFTLYEISNGERSFVALYEPNEGSGTNVYRDKIPEDSGHLQTIMTIVQTGTQQGETITSSQDSIDPTLLFDPDIGD